MTEVLVLLICVLYESKKSLFYFNAIAGTIIFYVNYDLGSNFNVHYMFDGFLNFYEDLMVCMVIILAS